ncbi:hypothetical protein [Alteribacter natronophilus]|uniref:hypothetical protein n=1 Tax=Alteribacter natronophilus TaxID=2583810 RepID=UPI00110F23C9|nr:hypothetical protein [Alteribacter natronophilus]TMW72235.1 hypothetical protein FGB90_08465 [Alteribacter natronophilus]
MFLKALKKKKLESCTHVTCTSCGATHTTAEWNESATRVYGEDSPDILTAAADNTNTFPYQCPTCFMGYSAHQLEYSERKSPVSIQKTIET